jgi:transcriptional regulator with XRE-family HTH domain
MADDNLFATVRDGDELVAALRARAESTGISFDALSDLAGLGEGNISKYLSPTRTRNLTAASMLRIATALGLEARLVVDPSFVPNWIKRDAKRIHARRPALGAATLKRVLKPAAAELGRRGHLARMRATSGEQRRNIARVAAAARWQKAATVTVRPLADPASPLQMWLDEMPDGAPE